jgi:cobalt-zinc-cadmium efflux system membrane fusion protein
MRRFVVAAAVLCTCTSGCRKVAAADQDSAAGSGARVEGQRLFLRADSGRLASLVSSPVGATAPDSVRLNGRLVWNEDVTVSVFSPFAGRVVKVLADAGRTVHAGDTLALIAAPDFGQAQADARRAATDMALAERTLTRTRSLFDHGVVAQKDMYSAEADVARARAELRRADARLTLYGADSASTDQLFALRAPLEGTVVERNITPGQEVRPDQMLANAPQLFAPLFVVTDPSRLWVQLDLPERDLDALKPDIMIAVTPMGAPGRGYPGRITTIAGAVDPTTRTVKARGTVENPGQLLKAEMLVSVTVPGTAARALVVFVEEWPGRYRRTEVQVGAGQNGMIPVQAGLHAGERVIVSGSLLLEQLFQQSAHG